jgi:hypothetical protein
MFQEGLCGKPQNANEPPCQDIEMSEYAERDPVAEELARRAREIDRLTQQLKTVPIVERSAYRQEELDAIREDGRKQGYQEALNDMKKQLEALQEKRRNT